MKRLIYVLLIELGLIISLLTLLPTSEASEEITMTNKEILERLTRLEEGQIATNKRLDDTNKRMDDFRADTNKRFEELRTDTNKQFDNFRAEVNRRFDDVNKRFDEMMFWLELLFGGMMLILAGIFTHGILLWRRQTRTETLLETHLKETEKDRLTSFQAEEIRILKERMERLEQKMAIAS